MAKGSKDFSILSSLRKDLEAQQRLREAEKRKEAERAKKAQASKLVFKNEMEKLGVKQVDLSNGRHSNLPPKPEPFPFQKVKADKEILQASLSDNLDIDHLIDADERVSYHSPLVAPDIPRKLRRGVWSVKGSLDLHGYTVPEARQLVVEFLANQRKAGNRVIRIIHGQGHGSVGKKPVLKEKVPVWLMQRQEVLAFVQAPEHDGGAGALLVLLAQ